MSTHPLMLEGQVDTRDEAISQLRMQVRKLDEALRLERNKNGQIEAALRELRHLTQPFHKLLLAVHGELDTLGIDESVVSHAPQTPAGIDIWKQRLGQNCSRIIDALLAHKAMNTTQLAMATGIHASNIPKSIYKLNKAGLLNKNGGVFSLKGA